MKYLFYLVAIAPILWEIICIYDLDRVHKFQMSFKKLKGKKFDEYSSNQKTVAVLMYLYMIWAFIGLFTFNWVAFLTLFTLSFIPKRNKYVRWVDSFLTIIILFFIVLNTFHFNVDLWYLITSA